MKRLLLVLTFLSIVSFSYAQTLKITDVKSRDDKMYSNAQNSLGKKLVLEIFDSNIKLSLAGEQKPMYLRMVSDNHYAGVTEDSSNEQWTAEVVVETTVGIVTSAVLTVTVSEKKSPYRSSSCTFVAKRF